MKKLLKDFNNIETSKDLQKRNLSLSDYTMLEYMIDELKTSKKAKTISKAVSDYCIKQGLKVKTHGIGYQIEL